MQKKYIVRLSGEERDTLKELIKKLKGTSQKVRRAQILLKADANGPSWSDDRIADAFSCRTRTVEKVRQRLELVKFFFPDILIWGKSVPLVLKGLRWRMCDAGCRALARAGKRGVFPVERATAAVGRGFAVEGFG